MISGEMILNFVILTVLVTHAGIAWTLLQTPGNLLDWLPQHIQRVRNPYVRDLLSCSKCVSGQAAFWNAVWIMWLANAWQWSGVAIMWVLMVIVLTDQLNRRYGYA